MTREQAINYLISSGFTHEQVGEVVRALTYEPTTKNDPKFCPDRKAKTTNMETILHCIENECVAYKDGKCLKYNSDQEPTTKNNLGVDLISRADVNRLICEYRDDATETGNERDLERAYGANAVGELISELPSVTPQEPQTFKWCTDCKEYDQEKHCCHRWSKVIRDTVEEMKQAQEPRKGEWLRMSDLSEQEDDRYKCSCCGNVVHHKNKMNLYTFNSWCGRCGSDNGRHINYEVEDGNDD